MYYNCTIVIVHFYLFWKGDVFMELGQKYKNDIISIQPFPMPCPFIVLNLYESIREAMLSPETTDALSGRPANPRDKHLNPLKCGMGF